MEYATGLGEGELARQHRRAPVDLAAKVAAITTVDGHVDEVAASNSL